MAGVMEVDGDKFLHYKDGESVWVAEEQDSDTISVSLIC